MRYEVKKDPNDESQWIIWDNLEIKVFARYNNEKQPTDIVNRYYAAQMAAEEAG